LLFAGVKIKDLMNANYTLQDFKNAGCTIKELKEAGFTIHELIQLPNIGLELRELKITPQKCLNLNCSSKLIQEFGYSSPELKRIGLSFNIARDGFIKNITQFDPKTGNKIRTNFFD
ncbi:hypothetical protein, partial sequence, partial [Candidatus Phytoplasma solani]